MKRLRCATGTLGFCPPEGWAVRPNARSTERKSRERNMYWQGGPRRPINLEPSPQFQDEHSKHAEKPAAQRIPGTTRPADGHGHR